MRTILLIAALIALAACAELPKREIYSCANGPTLAVVYDDSGATLTFPNGRTETLPATDKPDIYAKPGMIWNATEFRSARLNDGTTSISCDQMG